MSTSNFRSANFSFITTPDSDVVRIIKQQSPGQYVHFEIPFSVIQEFVENECGD